MGLFQSARYEQRAAKFALLGFGGAGKTTTAAYIAMGLSKEFCGGGPIGFFDTGEGSDFIIPKFEAEGIPFNVVKSASFPDLLAAITEAEKAGYAALIVDSISKVWKNLGRSYLSALAKRKRMSHVPTRLGFTGIAAVKEMWEPWTEAFLNSPLHIIVCGRAGYEWDEVDDGDQDDGEEKQKLVKTGTKMKVEGEFGYEPNLLIEMQRVPAAEVVKKRSRFTPGLWAHRAIILKDRTDTINGRMFDFEKPQKAYKAGDYKQVYKVLSPVCEFMRRSQGQRAVDVTRNSEALFPGPNGESGPRLLAQRKEVALAEAKGIVDHLWPGMDAKSKALRGVINAKLFDSYSWEAIATKPVELLENAVRYLRLFKEQLEKRGEPPADVKEILALLEFCVGEVDAPFGGTEAVEQQLAGAGPF